MFLLIIVIILSPMAVGLLFAHGNFRDAWTIQKVCVLLLASSIFWASVLAYSYFPEAESATFFHHFVLVAPSIEERALGIAFGALWGFILIAFVSCLLGRMFEGLLNTFRRTR